MPLRVDCDCNVFVTCCDGTEKQILNIDQVNKLIAGGAVNGAPQPKPGGCQVYDLTLIAGQLQIVPTIVNSGDTIELQATTGATTEDGVGWQCPDGEVYFGGACAGGGFFDASAFMPAVHAGRVILYLNGVYYDLPTPGVFTVPGGVVNKTPSIVVNYNPAAPIHSGTLQCKVKVCNSTIGQFTHHFDVRLVTGPFIIHNFGGNSNNLWYAGNGYICDGNGAGLAGNGVIALVCNNSAPLAHCTLRVVGTLTLGGGAAAQDVAQQNAAYPPLALGEVYTGTAFGAVDFSHAFIATLHQFYVDIGATGPNTAHVTLTDIYVTADGADPF